MFFSRLHARAHGTQHCVNIDAIFSLISSFHGFASLSERDVSNRDNSDEPAPKARVTQDRPQTLRADESKLKTVFNRTGRRLSSHVYSNSFRNAFVFFTTTRCQNSWNHRVNIDEVFFSYTFIGICVSIGTRRLKS